MYVAKQMGGPGDSKQGATERTAPVSQPNVYHHPPIKIPCHPQKQKALRNNEELRLTVGEGPSAALLEAEGDAARPVRVWDFSGVGGKGGVRGSGPMRGCSRAAAAVFTAPPPTPTPNPQTTYPPPPPPQGPQGRVHRAHDGRRQKSGRRHRRAGGAPERQEDRGCACLLAGWVAGALVLLVLTVLCV
jgi:hypothetical protein